MKPYDCNYTWDDVKNDANKLLSRFLSYNGDIVVNVYQNTLPRALDDIAKYTFIYGKSDFIGLFKELELVRSALIQLHKVGYIGKLEKGDNDESR